MELLGNQSSPWYLFAAVLFAISFTLIRVVGGSYYSYKWQIGKYCFILLDVSMFLFFSSKMLIKITFPFSGMYDVIMAGEHHSLVVYAFFSLCNAILMFLQYFWFTMVSMRFLFFLSFSMPNFFFFQDCPSCHRNGWWWKERQERLSAPRNIKNKQ